MIEDDCEVAGAENVVPNLGVFGRQPHGDVFDSDLMDFVRAQLEPGVLGHCRGVDSVAAFHPGEPAPVVGSGDRQQFGLECVAIALYRRPDRARDDGMELVAPGSFTVPVLRSADGGEHVGVGGCGQVAIQHAEASNHRELGRRASLVDGRAEAVEGLFENAGD